MICSLVRDLWGNPCLYEIQRCFSIVINKDPLQIEKILFLKRNYQSCHLSSPILSLRTPTRFGFAVSAM